VYLGKVAPSSAGVVYDESGNSNDAQLVNSYAMQGDGVVYAEAGNAAVHDGLNFTGAIIWYNNDTIGSLGGKFLASVGNKELTWYQSTITNLKLFYSGDGITESVANFAIISGWNTLEYEFNNGVFSYILNGVSSSLTLAYTSINTGAANLSLFAQTGGIAKFSGKIAYFKYGNAEFNLCNGGLIEAIPNTGTAGGDATLFNATYPTLWALQDVFHYNFLNGFDLYENGNVAEEIRVPIGHTFSQVGYTLTSSNLAGIWHNGAETEIEFPATLSSVQDVTPISSLTNNKYLEFINGSVKEATNQVNVFEVVNGARFFAAAGSTSYLWFNNAEAIAGRTYNYYLEVIGTTSSIYLTLGNINFGSFSNGIYTGSLTPTVDGNIRLARNTSPVDLIVSKLYVWEADTVPPLSYEEMESNYNGADIVFSNTEENKKKKIVAYDSARTTDEMITIQKCIDAKTGIDVLNDENGPVYSVEGLLVLIP